FKLRSPSKVAPGELAKILDGVAGKPEAELIQSVVLRSLKQARYQPANVGHFGLALDAYAHFTSPIRRYPDLLVHRGLKWLIRHGSARRFPYTLTDMEHLGEHTSRTERRADEAVWDVEERLKCIYLKERIGEEFEVVVASVTQFGLFVRLSELQIDGLIHVSMLPGDYYHRDATGTVLTGERTGRTYRLADHLRVRLTAVSVEDRKIDFVPIDEEHEGRSGNGRARSAGRGRRSRGRGGPGRDGGEAPLCLRATCRSGAARPAAARDPRGDGARDAGRRRARGAGRRDRGARRAGRARAPRRARPARGGRPPPGHRRRGRAAPGVHRAGLRGARPRAGQGSASPRARRGRGSAQPRRVPPDRGRRRRRCGRRAPRALGEADRGRREDGDRGCRDGAGGRGAEPRADACMAQGGRRLGRRGRCRRAEVALRGDARAADRGGARRGRAGAQAPDPRAV